MIIDELIKLIGRDKVLESEVDMAYAARDKSTGLGESFPLCIAVVASQSELIDVVRACLSRRVAVVVRAAGTGKSGGAIAGSDSVLIDITRLNAIITIDRQNLIAEVEPGLVLASFKAAVEEAGLYYPIDPASEDQCTLGGNMAENAAGPSTLKYGSSRDYLLGGQALIGSGELIDFGKRCPKGVSGFDIASLLCGSEGTLAIFTKLTLRLLPKAQSQAMGVFYFADEEKALSAVNLLLTQGHRPKIMEFIDHTGMLALKKIGHSDIDAQKRAALIIECDDHHAQGADLQLADIEARLKRDHLIEESVGLASDERQALWHMRKDLSRAYETYLGHKLSEDIAVPLGAMAMFSSWLKKKSQAPHLLCASFGHAGDGNLHVQILFDDQKWLRHAESIRHDVIMKTLALGGTLSAEHGIGLKKRSYLAKEQSPSLIELQKRIKQAFDPENLLNPGKIFE